MKSIDNIRNILIHNHSDLSKNFHVRRFGIFGSVAKGTTVEKSDIDMLVEFTRPISLFQFIALEQKLTELLGSPIDLATPDALKPAVRNTILRQTIYV